MRTMQIYVSSFVVIAMVVAQLYLRKYQDIDTGTYSSSALISERILVLVNALIHSNTLAQS